MFLDNLPIVNGVQTCALPISYREDTINSGGDLTDSKLYGYTIVPSKFYSYMTALTTVDFSESVVTNILASAFEHCTLLGSLEFMSGLINIENYAFQSCTSLQSVLFGDTLQKIAQQSFDGCTSLSTLIFPSSLVRIDYQGFSNCTNLTTVTFQGTPTAISSSAFNGCTNLTTINVPWASGTVSDAPWGATNATINYNYVG